MRRDRFRAASTPPGSVRQRLTRGHEKCHGGANLCGVCESKGFAKRDRGGKTSLSTRNAYRSIPILAILLAAITVHGPLLLMRLPGDSFDANFHIFFASHYAQHWFNPCNEKWFAGFSQTTYPPLTHQWIALLSNVVGLKMGYMLVQLIAVLLLPVGVFRFAKIWVDDGESSYSALGSIFLGALAFLVY